MQREYFSLDKSVF